MRDGIAAIAALFLVAACTTAPTAGDAAAHDGPPDGLAAVDPTIPATTTTILHPEDRASASEVRAEVAAAVQALLGSHSVSVRIEGAEIGYQLIGTVEIDLTTGDHRSSELEIYDTGTRVRSEHTLVGDTMYVRFDQGDDGTDEPFRAVAITADRQEFVDEALTMTGRAGASLERIVRYLEEIPFEAWTLGQGDVEGRSAAGYQVAFEAATISTFLRDNDLELVGPHDPEGSMVYEFWIDDDAGHLARMAIEGVHFQDGEALENFGGALVYQPGGPLTIAPPVD